MAPEHEVLIDADVIAETVRRLARTIDDDSQGESMVVLIVLKGAVIFAADLVRAMETTTELAFITASSYEGGFTPGDALSLQHQSELDVEGRHVLIVDDIIDTGRTLNALAAEVKAGGALSVSTAALINKTSRRTTEREPTYSGIGITDELIYGYGMDWDGQYRDLPYIAQANH